jgi:hypothetical protein
MPAQPAEPHQHYSPFLVLHNVTRVLATDGCRPKPNHDVPGAVQAANSMLTTLGIICSRIALPAASAP